MTDIKNSIVSVIKIMFGIANISPIPNEVRNKNEKIKEKRLFVI